MPHLSPSLDKYTLSHLLYLHPNSYQPVSDNPVHVCICVDFSLTEMDGSWNIFTLLATQLLTGLYVLFMRFGSRKKNPKGLRIYWGTCVRCQLTSQVVLTRKNLMVSAGMSVTDGRRNRTPTQTPSTLFPHIPPSTPSSFKGLVTRPGTKEMIRFCR